MQYPLDIAAVRRLFRLTLFERSQVTSEHLVREGLSSKALNPKKGSFQVRETLLITGETHVATDLTETLGQLRLDVFVTRTSGTDLADCVAREIAFAFRHNQDLCDEAEDLALNLYGTNRESAGTAQDVNFFIPVVIRWRAHTFLPLAN